MEDLEFEEMRKQISILKNKLDDQSIVNDYHLRQSMKTKVSALNAEGRKSSFFACLALMMFPCLHNLGISAEFIICSMVMMILCVIGNIYIHLPVKDKDLLNGNVSEVATRISKVKKQYQMWLKYVTPVIVPWGVWYALEVSEAMGLDREQGIYMTIGLMLAMSLGASIGMKMHRKVVNSCDEILEQLYNTDMKKLEKVIEKLNNSEQQQARNNLSDMKIKAFGSLASSFVFGWVAIGLHWGEESTFSYSVTIAAIILSLIFLAVTYYTNRKLLSASILDNNVKELTNILEDYKRANKAFTLHTSIISVVFIGLMAADMIIQKGMDMTLVLSVCSVCAVVGILLTVRTYIQTRRICDDTIALINK